MHKSLRPVSSLIVMALTASVATVFVVGVSHPRKMLLLAIGGSLGAVTGALQLFALRAARERFLTASTALEVRKAMTASKPGVAAISLVWLSAAVLIFVTFAERGAPAAGAIGGFATFVFVREAIALKGCYDLQRSART